MLFLNKGEMKFKKLMPDIPEQIKYNDIDIPSNDQSLVLIDVVIYLFVIIIILIRLVSKKCL